MAKKTNIEQPEQIWKEKLAELLNAEPSEFQFRGKTRKMYWIHNRTYLKFEHVMVTEEDGWKRNIKLASLLLMNVRSGFWSMVRTKFLYPLHWRWLYYVQDVDMQDVLSVLESSKKKIPSESYLLCTMLATAVMDELVGMTRKAKEVKAGQAARNGDSSSR